MTRSSTARRSVRRRSPAVPTTALTEWTIGSGSGSWPSSAPSGTATTGSLKERGHDDPPSQPHRRGVSRCSRARRDRTMARSCLHCMAFRPRRGCTATSSRCSPTGIGPWRPISPDSGTRRFPTGGLTVTDSMPPGPRRLGTGHEPARPAGGRRRGDGLPVRHQPAVRGLPRGSGLAHPGPASDARRRRGARRHLPRVVPARLVDDLSPRSSSIRSTPGIAPSPPRGGDRRPRPVLPRSARRHVRS